jgi:magnesium chelatase subunit I
MTNRNSQLLKILRSESAAQRVLQTTQVDFGLNDVEPFPFLAIVGQKELKLALILAVVNPLVGGVLLIGSRGTAKTTAVRSLIDLLPLRRRSLCPNGCTEKMLDQFGLDGICDSCAERVGYGEPLSTEDRVRIVELPLNANLDDVVGGINERLALEQRRLRLERGLLAQANGNILFIDEVNLLDPAIADAILDAASQGYYTVRRGPLNLQYQAQFILIGSMNPEEGRLRPQIMDRFGLRAVTSGLEGPDSRYQAYEQAISYRRNPAQFASAYADSSMMFAEEIEKAIARLPQVSVNDEARSLGLSLIKELEIDSSRAEITLFEAARAYAAIDDRLEVSEADIESVSRIALRMRQSSGITEFMNARRNEDDHLLELLNRLRQENSKEPGTEPEKDESA